MKSFGLFLSIFSMLTIMWGCAANGGINNEDIFAEWWLDKAQKNGEITETLDGLFMNFDQNGKVRSNISGFDTVLYDFEVRKKTIIFDDGEEFSFEVKNLSKDSLELSSRIRGVDFNFWFYAK